MSVDIDPNTSLTSTDTPDTSSETTSWWLKFFGKWGVVGAFIIAIIMIFINWKSSSNKTIAIRSTEKETEDKIRGGEVENIVFKEIPKIEEDIKKADELSIQKEADINNVIVETKATIEQDKADVTTPVAQKIHRVNEKWNKLND